MLYQAGTRARSIALQMMCSPAACSSMKTSIFGVVEYVIRMATPSTARDCRPCRKSCTHALHQARPLSVIGCACASSSHHISCAVIKCDGSWGDWNTSFSVGRYETARVSRNFGFMTTGTGLNQLNSHSSFATTFVFDSH